MSGLFWWSLGIGAGLVAVSALLFALGLGPAGILGGLLGLAAVVIAGYEAVYEWLGRAELRRRGARARREWEAREDR